MKWNTHLLPWVLTICGPAFVRGFVSPRDLPSISLPILAVTPNVESDKVSFYYGKKPLLIGNDGSAHLGGLHVFDTEKQDKGTIPEVFSKVTGRTKVVSAVYSVAKEDYLVTFSTPEHLLRFYELPSGKEVKSATKFVLAEFSALCGWRSPVTNAQYIYLFGKKEVRVYLLQEKKNGFQVVEVTSFVLPIEAETCAAPVGESVILFGGSDKKLYTFAASDLPSTPKLNVVGETEEEIAGAAVYQSSSSQYYYLIAFEESISVYTKDFKNVGTINIDAGDGLELSDIAIYQGKGKNANDGYIAYAFESDDAGKGFGISSLSPIFPALKIKKNTDFSPEPKRSSIKFPTCSSVDDCNSAGFCTSKSTCACYLGYTGKSCSKITCPSDCSNNGRCVAANTCSCRSPFTGPDCSTLSVEPTFETEASGADGDDPAIWVTSGKDKSASKIITTTKSEDNPGLSVFDLKGKKLQFLAAEEPNNVDVIYGFPFGGEKIDLAYAACRGDDTLCLFRIDSQGLLSPIAGGSQPTREDFSVYGSCVYHRHRDDKFYLFVNSKEAVYLQYELTSSNNTLQTTLVREFSIGTGTQPEGCVVDDDNEVIFIGEEQVGLWKYGANPTDPGTGAGVLVDSVDKSAGGRVDADVEGIALVYGPTKSQGYIIVSQQGVSSYNVYERKAPHKFVLRFSIGDNEKKGVDKVTNTDGVAAVGTGLGKGFEEGLIVVHDDANERKEGGTDENASFKLVSLGDVLGKRLGREVDWKWDPRA